MSTFLVDSKNDLVLVGDTLQIENGLQGALLTAKHYAQTLRGEMMHDTQSGVRFFDTVFNASRLQLFEMDFRRRVMQCMRTANGKDVSSTHTHSGITPGPSNTGPVT